MTDAPIRRAEGFAVLAACFALSLIAAIWSWTHSASLNYGDAVAHLHIARRVFDSHRPGLTQLGSVWLPLPHLVLIPFVAVYSWWANGLAGLIPSALAYLVSCLGLYRLARRWLRPLPAAIALAFFAGNPNLLYLQTTAMTEPLFLCEFVWTILFLVEWRSALDHDPGRANRLLWPIALLLVAAVFTRYDGWILAFLAWTFIGILLLRRGRLRSRAFWLATLLVLAAPTVWFVYNAACFGDWLYFARGPYSAKAIEIRTASSGSGPPHPGWHNPWVGLLFFVKASEMDSAALPFGSLLLLVSAFGALCGWLLDRRRAFSWTLLLWFPIPFYAYSIAYGSVPIFLPVWWPHSFYNTRYGMEMLPAFALGLGFAAHFALGVAHEFKPRWTRYVAVALFALIALNAAQLLRQGPLTYVESTKNIRARRPLLEQIPPVLRSLLASRPGAIVLMDTSTYPQLVTLTGIPLRQTLNESDKQFYRAALAAPASHAAIVLAFHGDEIDRAVHDHPAGLTLVRRFTFRGQPGASIYVSGNTSGTPPVSALSSSMPTNP
ncbi:MAG TPA: glycosyltransferase family 39 protein [Terracidiphilus sp.]|nr:glycosyltransferase family 39 protein [Terracidiphilus sp.]